MKAHWGERPLHELAERIFVGIASAATHAYRESGVLLLRNMNIKEGGIDRSDLIYIDPSYEAQHSRKRLKAGDVLTVRTGYAGVSAVLPDDLAGSQCFTALVTRPDSQALDSNYLALFLNSPMGERAFTITEAGGSQKNVNAGALEQLLIPTPPLDEQRRIAATLLDWDTAIQKAEHLIAAKNRHFAATSHLLLTSKKRIHGFTSHWDFRRADAIFRNISRKGNLAEPLLSVTQDRGVIPRDMLEGRVAMPTGETNSFKLVEPGNFVISLRSFQGGLEHSDYRGLVSPAYTVLQNLVEIDDQFFRHYFKSADFIKRLSVAVIGIRDGKQISFQDFCSIKIPVPPLAEQRAIADFLGEAEKEIRLLKKYLLALKCQKRGLMRELLTGHWRLGV